MRSDRLICIIFVLLSSLCLASVSSSIWISINPYSPMALDARDLVADALDRLPVGVNRAFLRADPAPNTKEYRIRFPAQLKGFPFTVNTVQGDVLVHTMFVLRPADSAETNTTSYSV